MTASLLLAVVIAWSAPTHRINGDPVSPEEVSGYEVRVECNEEYEYFMTTEVVYSLPESYSSCSLEVAAYDSYGIYSRYRKLVPSQTGNKPEAPTQGGFR